MRLLSALPEDAVPIEAIGSCTAHPRARAMLLRDGNRALRWPAVAHRCRTRRRASPTSAVGWERSAVSQDKKYHVRLSDGSPLYSARFGMVQEFHPPGASDVTRSHTPDAPS